MSNTNLKTKLIKFSKVKQVVVINKLIIGNREWVEDKLKIDKDYFLRLSHGQNTDDPETKVSELSNHH